MARIMMLSVSINSHSDYLHWEQLRYKPLPEGIPSNTAHEDYWAAIKFHRAVGRRYLPFKPKSQDDMKFSFGRPDCLLAALRHIDLKSGGTVSSGDEVIGRQDGQRFLTRSVIEEPFSSSVLEGAATTRVRAHAMIEKGEMPISRDDRMVLNNYEAMMFVKEHINSPLTPEIVLECHRIVTQGTLDRPDMSGRYRDNNDVVVGDDYGEVFHQPPDYSELADRMKDLCDFANSSNDEDEPYIHPIVRAIILHFALAFDHPFVDGNGRTARALFYWSVLRSGYWMMEYLSISTIIKNAPVRYGKAFLYTETDDNDVTYFIMHQLDVIKKAIVELEKYLDRQKQKYRANEQLLSRETLNHRQKYLLTEFIRGRIFVISIKDHQSQHSVSYLTARKDLDDLERDGWLKKNAVGRKYIYKSGAALDAIKT